mgnify:CR=1 FL=1
MYHCLDHAPITLPDSKTSFDVKLDSFIISSFEY